MENNEYEMTIENLKQKIENQAKVIKELTNENEELYHQYNHLIIRNGKMLRRTDDYQKIIDDLHIRNEELQLINGNIMELNDKLRKRGDYSTPYSEDRTSDRIKLKQEITIEKIESEFNLNEIFERWKKYPGQLAHNGPNLRKQVLMLVHLYSTSSLRAAELFGRSGVGGVTGARYVSTLKKYNLIRFVGARKKGHYEITSKGKELIETTNGPDKKQEHEEQKSVLNFKDENFSAVKNVPDSIMADQNDL